MDNLKCLALAAAFVAAALLSLRFPAWRAGRKEVFDQAAYDRGFDWGAGRLLRDPIQGSRDIEQQTEAARDFGSFNTFDKGALAALGSWQRQYT